MATPVVTCGANQFLTYSGGAQLVSLAATATEGASNFQWTLLSVPIGSTALTETRGGFINGVSNLQNPTFETDPAIEGSYVFQCIANNGEPSVPDNDKASAQQVIVVKTQRFDLTYANDFQWEWGNFVNNSLSLLETAIGTVAPLAHNHVKSDITDFAHNHTASEVTDFDTEVSNNTDVAANTSARHNHSNQAQLDLVTDGDHDVRSDNPHSTSLANIGSGTLANLNTAVSDATLIDTADSRLSDARTPTSHATSHTSGQSDAIKLDDLATPDDNTDLDSTTGRHGLLPKLGGGTTNFLRADGAWAAPAGGGGSPLTTKGDIFTYSTTDTRLPLGTNGQVLVADSAETTGMRWGDLAPAGGESIVALDADPTATTTSATFVDVTGVSDTFTVNKAGKYLALLHTSGYATASATIVRWRVNFDTDTIVTDDDNQFNVQFISGQREFHCMTFLVDLTAGSHDVKLQWRRITGSGTITLAGSGDHVHLNLMLVAGDTVKEEEFTATGGDENFVLTDNVSSNGSTLSAYDILGVYRNGIRLQYKGTPTTNIHYGFTAPKTINCKSLTASDNITVVYK